MHSTIRYYGCLLRRGLFIFHCLVREQNLYLFLWKNLDYRLGMLTIREQICVEKKMSEEFVGFER